jgi:enoyl-CoA hydratase
MSEYNHLLVTVEDHIAHVTINRADKLNALNLNTIDDLRQFTQTLYHDDSIKGAIISGAGEKAFVAGADISEIAELSEVNARKFAESGQEVFQMIESSPKPVIAAINGFALGGGCELAMACHLRIATPNARFGQPEVNLGVIPGYGGTQRLCQLIGKSKALELMLTADLIDAQTALNLGLVNYVVTAEELKPRSIEILSKILSKAPRAIEMVIQCVNAAYDPTQNGYQTEANGFANCCQTNDFKEGTAAFLEKRPANFKGN